jgi:copper(I)-binding protein
MSTTVRNALGALFGAAAFALSPAAAQEYRVGSIKIEAPWLRATPAGAEVAGGYMKIENTGTDADRLIGGSATVAGKLEVHEMSMVGSVMKMRQLDKGLELKPGQRVELKPGSYHLMLMGLKQQLKGGDKVKGTLMFEKAGTVEVEYTVRGPGGGSSSNTGGHGGHGGGHGTTKH